MRFVWGHSDTSWAHHHDVTILSHYDFTDTQDDYVTIRSQCRHSVMSQIYDMSTSSWGHSVVTGRCSPCEIIMISKLWHYQCDVFVRSQWYKLSTSPWGHSAVTVWCHKYSRWLHHHEVTVLSHDDAHLMRSLWCTHDIKIMTSHVSDVCYVTVTNAYHITMMSQCCHSIMSQVHEMTTSPWGHSAATRRCPPYEVTMMSSWYQNYDITCVRCLFGHSDKSLPHHCEVTVLS